MKGDSFYATGRRKSAIARVWLRPGSGLILVNKLDVAAYFERDSLKMMIEQPLAIAGGSTTFDIEVFVHGGGKSAQAGAMRLGMSRALVNFNPDLKSVLRQGGFLTRDPREKERKKYGQPGARKRFQYSKR